jgi:hypothetical protein
MGAYGGSRSQFSCLPHFVTSVEGHYRVQCLAEMYACQWNNRQRGQHPDVFGIVSNGPGWRFYQLRQTSEVFETDLYTMAFLPELLGVLDYVCAECARNVP